MKYITVINISLLLAVIMATPYYHELGWYGLPVLASLSIGLFALFNFCNDKVLQEQV